MFRPGQWTMCALACGWVPLRLMAQEPDTTRPYTLPPATVSVTRSDRPLTKVPLAIHGVDRAQISRAQPTWGLDEALANVPGVFVANRYNFSQDQRISIRGFGARSAFAVRGIRFSSTGSRRPFPTARASSPTSSWARWIASTCCADRRRRCSATPRAA